MFCCVLEAESQETQGGGGEGFCVGTCECKSLSTAKKKGVISSQP